MNRRTFLGYLSGITGLSFLSTFSVHQVTEVIIPLNPKLAALPFFLDTLIPEDETPSASALGVHLEIIRHAKKITNYPKLLELGCHWLDMNAKKRGFNDYASLPEAYRILIVEKAEREAINTTAKIFFDRILADSFRFYYSNPASWSALGLSSPPQPIGYPDYTSPPKRV